MDVYIVLEVKLRCELFFLVHVYDGREASEYLMVKVVFNVIFDVFIGLVDVIYRSFPSINSSKIVPFNHIHLALGFQNIWEVKYCVSSIFDYWIISKLQILIRRNSAIWKQRNLWYYMMYSLIYHMHFISFVNRHRWLGWLPNLNETIIFSSQCSSQSNGNEMWIFSNELEVENRVFVKSKDISVVMHAGFDDGRRVSRDHRWDVELSQTGNLTISLV